MADFTGTPGNDTMPGTAGADNLTGLGGDDLYTVNHAGDAVFEANNEGFDRVLASVSWVLTAGSFVEMVTTNDNLGTAAINLTGNALSQYIYGNAASNQLDGGGGGDVLVGLGGDDFYTIRNAADRVVEAAGGGYDRVLAAANFTLEAGSEVELFTTIDNLATTALNLTGNNLSQYIYGNAGSNQLDGGGGGDVLVGLGGDDFYTIRSAADRVVESSGGGYDRVLAAASFALEAGSEVELFTTIDNLATTSINLTGNNLAQYIYGNAGANQLDGGGGGDVMVGLGGDDFYTIRNVLDRVVESAGGGNDRVLAAASFTLEAGSEVELFTTIDNLATTAINLTGNNLAQYIYGNAGSNSLDGGGGDDVMVGLGGDDFYTIRTAGDRVVEAAGGGSDRIFAAANFTLEAGSEVELFTTVDNLATTAINLTGNELAQYIYGNAGANSLDGGGGGDVMVGLGGDDFYTVRNAADRVVEAAGGGSDRIFAAASFTLEAGSEVELFTTIDNLATTAIDLAGNELAQYIYGNDGANVLDGGAGADVLTGLGGADTFAFTTALGGANIDRIADFQAGVDKIRLAGASGGPFAALATGPLIVGTVVSGPGAVAADANDYLIYDSTTGALLYDADGNGAGAAVQFATLSTGLTLSAADFLVSGPANAMPVVTSGAAPSIAENSPASTIVYQATATDADGDRITWSLSGADAGFLTIDAVTGAVRLTSSPDFETKASYSFNVVASDSASSTPKAVTLTVTDVADSVTPIINETSSPNDDIASAQMIDRSTLLVANNPNLHNPGLPSATIVGNVSTHADKDFFAIALQAGEQLILDVDIDPANGLDSFLTLYGPNMVLIGDNDDLFSHDPGSGTQFNHNTDSQIIFRAAVTGTYYFSVGAFDDGDPNTHEDDSSGPYSLNVSIGPPATPQQLIQEDVAALPSGESWNHLGLSYGFPTSANQYPDSFKEPDSGFTPFSGTQQAATRLLLQLIGNVTPLTFTELASNPGNADLRYGMSNLPDVAYAYYPTNDGPSSLGGTAWFNHNSFSNPQQGNYAWMGILHETGHALGLKHGHEFPLAISADRDSVEYSVMTYRSYPGQDLSGGGGYSNETNSYPQTLMMYDVAALQQIYGANYNFNSGDSVYTWNPNTGRMLINGGIATTPSGNRVFLTIWDGGGNDSYDLSNYTVSDTLGPTTIDLRPGEWSIISQTQLANLGQGHQARGNVANALLYQGNSASLIENAIGSQANDTIIANQAANHLTGNGGADTFKWMASSDAGTGGQADTIMDFAPGTDRIDLSPIDAIPGTGANDAFTFIGTSAFHNVAGELRYDVTGGNAHIFADLDGNGVADWEIIVNNVTTLAGPDFVF